MYDYTPEKYPKFVYQPAAMPTVEQRVMSLCKLLAIFKLAD